MIDLNRLTEKELILLTEDDFRKKIVIPLLHDIKAFSIVDLHGINECGLDIFFEQRDIFKRNRCYGIQCKKGNINRSASNIPNSIITICNQIELAFTKEFRDSENKKVKINGFYLVVSGQINGFAKEYISEKSGKLPYIDFIDGQYLISMINGHKHFN